MLNAANKVAPIRVVTSDPTMSRRIRNALDHDDRFSVEVVEGSLSTLPNSVQRLGAASLLICDIGSDSAADLEALEVVLRSGNTPPSVIILSDNPSQAIARRLIKLPIADLLSRSATDREIFLACDQVLRPGAAAGGIRQARVTAFLSVCGGSGATTLCVAAAPVLAGKGKNALSQCCVIDLNLQSGTLPDYLNVTPGLQLAEISARPDRLDSQMLDVMIARHTSGLAVLAAPPTLLTEQAIGPEIIGRLLDLSLIRFQHLILNLPSAWQPWSDNVVRGADAVYLVTELTVTGLRQAHRAAEALRGKLGSDSPANIIVNKTPWLAGDVTRKHARDALGGDLVGFVPNRASLAREAQNRGLLLSQVKRGNRIESALRRILVQPQAAGARPLTHSKGLYPA